ncbi:hypothetical protein ABZ135_30855 [Streptomyces sp. NPDC006339]
MPPSAGRRSLRGPLDTACAWARADGARIAAARDDCDTGVRGPDAAA